VPAFTLAGSFATSGSSIGDKGRLLARSRSLALYRVDLALAFQGLVIFFAWAGATKRDR